MELKMHKVGEIIEIDGKTYVITHVNGYHFSYAPFDGPAEPALEEPVEVPVKRRRSKKNG